jgi:hypothetical protein
MLRKCACICTLPLRIKSRTTVPVSQTVYFPWDKSPSLLEHLGPSIALKLLGKSDAPSPAYSDSRESKSADPTEY